MSRRGQSQYVPTAGSATRHFISNPESHRQQPPMSFALSWVDHDQEARNRVEKILALLNEREARDELGLGPIRDSLG